MHKGDVQEGMVGSMKPGRTDVQVITICLEIPGSGRRAPRSSSLTTERDLRKTHVEDLGACQRDCPYLILGI